jgi:hypothetical protein
MSLVCVVLEMISAVTSSLNQAEIKEETVYTVFPIIVLLSQEERVYMDAY